jgi:hypothetical protein
MSGATAARALIPALLRRKSPRFPETSPSRLTKAAFEKLSRYVLTIPWRFAAGRHHIGLLAASETNTVPGTRSSQRSARSSVRRAGPKDVGISCRTRPFQTPLGA